MNSIALVSGGVRDRDSTRIVYLLLVFKRRVSRSSKNNKYAYLKYMEAACVMSVAEEKAGYHCLTRRTYS